MNIHKARRKLADFFLKATKRDIAALLKRANYEFYKNVKTPNE